MKFEKPHILFFTDNFPPEVNAPASRTFEHCREWVAQGARVTIVTSAPNFPEGRIHQGYRNRLWQASEMDGMRVVRVWTFVAPNAGFVKRILDFLSYMVTASVSALFIRRVDVVVGTSPHLFVTCAAALIAAIKRKPFVFELRDLWPESIKTVGAMKQARVIGWLEKLELFLYRRADLVVAVTHAFKANLVSRGIASEKIEVITNGADLERFAPGPAPDGLADRLHLRGKFVAGYIGTHGVAHGLSTLLDAAEILKERSDGGDIEFLMIGAGAERASLRRAAEDRQIDNVHFLDPVPKDQIAGYWRLIDAAVIHLKDYDLFRTVIPSKSFEAMATGTPILLGVRGEAAEIVHRSGCGIVFEPEDAQALADNLVKLRHDPQLRSSLGANGIAAAPQFDRKSLAHEMLRHIERLAVSSQD